MSRRHRGFGGGSESRFHIGQTVTGFDKVEDCPADPDGQPLFVNIAIGQEFHPGLPLPRIGFSGALRQVMHYSKGKPKSEDVHSKILRSAIFRKSVYIEIAGKRLFLSDFWDNLAAWPDNTGVVVDIIRANVTAVVVMRRGDELWYVAEKQPFLDNSSSALGRRCERSESRASSASRVRGSS